MTTQDAAQNIGTLRLGPELKYLPEVLAGLEQIKVAAQEAAAAVASIGGQDARVHDAIYRQSAAAGMVVAPYKIDAAAAAFAEQWVKEVRTGRDVLGMLPRTADQFAAAFVRFIEGATPWAASPPGQAS
ncbi:hypothetical protein [Massilia rubra]|uniref:Phasin domain-containing protein n=1 Tax=Massilia rubra TaxID=2607910 RepID=A0ABX0LWM1_9BURK|nr:hypothetical protein [Massilia rubra]NHZ38349.1 hypothetical protein [Massilia rubra]